MACGSNSFYIFKGLLKEKRVKRKNGKKARSLKYLLFDLYRKKSTKPCTRLATVYTSNFCLLKSWFSISSALCPCGSMNFKILLKHI